MEVKIEPFELESLSETSSHSLLQTVLSGGIPSSLVESLNPPSASQQELLSHPGQPVEDFQHPPVTSLGENNHLAAPSVARESLHLTASSVRGSSNQSFASEARESKSLAASSATRDGIHLPSFLSSGESSLTAATSSKIHVLVTDNDGSVLFDSGNYNHNVFVQVYSENGNLVYSSSRHPEVVNQNGLKQKNIEPAKLQEKMGAKKKKGRPRLITTLVKQKKNGKRGRRRKSGVKMDPYVVLERLECLASPWNDTSHESKNTNKDCDNPEEADIVKLTKCYIEEADTINEASKDLEETEDTDSAFHELTETACDKGESGAHVKDASVNNTNTELEEEHQTVVRSKRKSHRTRKSVGRRKRKEDASLSMTKANQDVDKKTRKLSNGPTLPVACDICGVTYKSQVMLDRHKAAHTVEDTNAENPLQCTVCLKVYPSWRSLTIHKRKHYAAKDNVCMKCGKGFRTKQELVRHEFVHTTYKSSPCHICGKLFKNKAYAQMHSKLHSAENRKYDCKICGKTFLRGPDIQKHMRIHTGEKPFICSQCGRSFSESSHLIRHERLHTGEKPYKCETCDQRFTHREVLIRHSFTHMEQLPFSCEVCNKGFKTKRELNSHWLVHDKPTDPSLKQTCKVCGKVFNHILYLRYHMRTHNNLGSFECPVCGKVFKKPAYLKQHVVNQHPYTSIAEYPVAPEMIEDQGEENNSEPIITDIEPKVLDAEVEHVVQFESVSKNIKELLVQHLKFHAGGDTHEIETPLSHL